MKPSGSIISRLLMWFAENGRHELPWRVNRSLYRVWVSEIMLQQTQVRTVLEYYSRFLAAFPDVLTLAEAEEETVLRHWEGLGYYRRARQMHAAAKKIVADYNGEFPTEFSDVLALPGIGRYTAGALLSFACDKRFPILEANTQRLFARLNALNLPTASSVGQKILWETAENFVSEETSSASPCNLNTALMDLGSLVCTPQNPQCDVCPLSTECEARKNGLTAQIPVSAPKMNYESRNEATVCVLKPKRRGKATEVCLLRYVPGEWWAGLWDFPRTKIETEDCVQEMREFLFQTTGLKVTTPALIGTFRHSVTRYRISLQVFQAEIQEDTLREQTPAGGEIRWMSMSTLDTVPLCTTGRKIVKLLEKMEKKAK